MMGTSTGETRWSWRIGRMTGIEGEERDCGCGRDNTRIEREREREMFF